MNSGASIRVGVVGAGTMGAGIAQVAVLAGFETVLHDPFPEALRAGSERIEAALVKGAERERWDADQAAAARERLTTVEAIAGVSGCELIIEAVPEDMQLKHELFNSLSEQCPESVLATNTSSLPVTAIASAAGDPSKVVGMHFFNPPALMKLLEVVAGVDSDPAALELATAVGKQMGKEVVAAKDVPGFIANRCARPFSLESLKLAQERVADHETIDRIVRMGGGFRMGPFELMDLVGIDVGFEVSKSFWEQSFHEPRWKPSTIAQQMVQAGKLGRKTGSGYYDYADGVPQPNDETPSSTELVEGMVVIEGDGSVAQGLRASAAECGYEPVRLEEVDEDLDVALVIDATVGRAPGDSVLVAEDPNTALCIICVDGSLSDLDAQGNAIGFHLLSPVEDSKLVELTRAPMAADATVARVTNFFESLGKRCEWVDDAPGLVLGRIFCQLVNEAAFAVSEQVCSPGDVDVAMRAGYNYPRGPLEWADIVELDQVLATLDALRSELGEERYRAAPLLRRMVAEGRLGRSVGEGFFSSIPD